MAYYDTFLATNGTPPSVRWRERLQEGINKQFENASTYWDDIEEEIAFGTLKFKTIVARVTQVVDAKTGQRNNDDYKKIIFQDISYFPPYGTRYRFDNNIWIVYSTSNIRTDTVSVYVRRCNNTMNTQDSYGNIHKEPCVIDYKVTENQLFRNPSIDVPSGRIYVICQLNKYTKDVNIEDRYIFGDDIYKVRERNKFDRTETFVKESGKIVSYYADYDNKADYDSLKTGVADYKEFNYRISIETSVSNQVGFSGQLDYKVILDDDVVPEPVRFESTNPDIASIDSLTGAFVLHEVGACEFIAAMVNKPDTVSIVNVSVVDQLDDNFTTDISPTIGVAPDEIGYLNLNSSLKYTVFGRNNGAPQAVEYTFTVTGVQDRNYTLTIVDGNTFIVKNKRTTDDIMTITCVPDNPDYPTGKILLRLGGLG